MREHIIVEVGATKDPTKKIKLKCTKDLVEDLDSIYSLDAKAELQRIVQDEVDKEYERKYGNKVID